MEYVCPTAYGEGGNISAGFTADEPRICKAINGELGAAMAIVFLLFRSSCSKQDYVSLHHTVVLVGLPLEI